MKLDYRYCVVGVFTNEKGEILVGERADTKGAWQLPQGGIEPGESSLAALYREMLEELGTASFEVIDTAARLVKYKFPEGLETGAAQRYCGQTQQWYLLKFKNGSAPDLKKGDGEFVALTWTSPKKVLEGIITWKREAYEQGLKLLGFEI